MRFVEWGLPDTSAFAASVQANPPKPIPGQPVTTDLRKSFHGWGQDRYLSKATWDLIAQVNSDPKKTAPKYPSPAVVKKARSPSPLDAQRPGARQP